MNEIILSMLDRYQCKAKSDYENALKEIIQEVTLLGLWRSKFFEHALFYGGSALRILYSLNRFSEDLDFSLLTRKSRFDFAPYLKSILDELNSFGFTVKIYNKRKNKQTQIESAFIKAETHIQFIQASVPKELLNHVQGNESLKIKIEVDTDPPSGFMTEVKNLLRPIPFQVKTMPIEDLFAGKMHAILARKWKTRVKGRDFYDLLWYLGNKAPCHLKHLKERLIQSGNWNSSKVLNRKDFMKLLKNKIKETDFQSAQKDVANFLKPHDRDSLKLWSQSYFMSMISKIKVK